MNKVITAVIALLMSINLIGCSSNTQQQNTTTGAIAGALIGGGAGAFVGQGVGKAVAVGVGLIGGALIGGYIGHEMDSSDKARMNTSMNNATYKSSTWTNKKTGVKYSMKPTSSLYAVQGNSNCRQYESTATYDGKTQATRGTACLQQDGSWTRMPS